MKDIVNSFNLSAIHKSSAIVSVDRLAWLNKQHIRAGLAPIEGGGGGSSAMHAKAQKLLMEAYGPNVSSTEAVAAISLVRCRLNVISDVVSESRFLFEEPVLQLPLPSLASEIVRQFAAALHAAAESMNTKNELLMSPEIVKNCFASAAATATAAAIAAVRSATALKPSQLFPPIRFVLTVPSAPFPVLLSIHHHHTSLCRRVILRACQFRTLCQVSDFSALYIVCRRLCLPNEDSHSLCECCCWRPLIL
jgi:glutamyl/glutaminyl-tRNA synthetase